MSVRKMKAPTVKMETVTLIAKGRQKLTYFVYYKYETNSNLFLAGILFLRGHLRFR